jgi:hypothetical protein
MKVRIQAGAQLDALIVTAPEQVRAPLRKLTSRQRIRACAALRPRPVRLFQPELTAEAAGELETAASLAPTEGERRLLLSRLLDVRTESA